VAFASGASNLVPDDTNGKVDVFVHELGNSSPAPDLYDLIWHDQRPAGDLNPIQLPRQGQETVEVVFKSAGPDFAPADLVLYLRKDPLGASSPSPGGPHDSYFHAPLWDAGEDIDNETYYPVATAESAGQAADGAPLYRFTFSLSGNDCTTETCPPCPTPEACQHRLEAYGIPTHYYREDFGVRRRGSDGWLTAPAGKGANPDGYANAWYHIELTEKPDPPPEHESAEPPPGDTGANGRIAFTSKRDGNNEIYVINADGSGLTNLTNHPGNDTGAAWSPDGTRIAFVSDRHGTSDIYVMNADGSEQTRLTSSHYSEIHPAWSPDGTRIAFVYHYGNDEIYVMNADGSGETPLTENEAFVVDSFPAWSPDGTRIAFQRSPLGDTEIYVINTDGTGLMNLTNHPDEDFFGLSWSPDGRRIAFTSDRDRNSEIYVMNADGSAQTRLTNNSLWDSSPTWSPDGQHLAFMSHRNDNYDIYVMNADGSGQVRLTDNPARDSWPDWSPALSSPDAYTCPRTPIVLVPGYYASAYPWTGQPGWTIRAAGVYQRLEVALFERGYQRDQGFFIAFYDWTQSNDVSANTQLRPVIQRALDKNPGCDKVHIIAHSNGGLVSRALVQNETASHVDTLIMIATPNHGITSAYPAWAGGEVGLEDPAIRWLLLLLMCQHHPSWCANSRPISDQAVWAFIHEEPGLESLGQLLPTRPFLTPNGRKEAIPIRELAADDRNDFLIELNENIQDLTDDTEAVYIIAGTGQETDAAIRVGEPGPAPYWPNGRPVGYPTAPIPVFVGDGDGRVLLSSALLPGISHQTIPDGHTSIVGNDATLQYIFEWLDLGAPVLPEPVPAPTPQEALVAELASPAHLLFTDPQGRRIGFDATSTFFDEIPNATYVGEGNEPKLVYIPDPLEGDYDVQVIGIGNGVYHLFGGTQNSDEFLMVDTGTTSPGKVEQHTAAYVPTGPPPSPEQIIGEWPAASPTGSLTLRNYLTGGALVCGGLFTLLLLAGVLVVRRWRRRPADSAVTTPPPGPVPPAPPVPDVAQGDHLLRKGIAQIKAGDAMEGYRTLRRLIEHSPRDAEAWLWIGWAATQTGDHRAAERCFLRAQQLGHPKAERALEWLNR
jgi:sugar lactone lactonase YvrE